jgi:nitrogenase cofactor biosynthesis protein NifB
MPMGAVSALCGIKNCMSVLHGSQGCATYIRRHMATHYNEPIDIASSSLTEEGTVFGGEKNLIKGLKNLIALYNPEVIGVCTTCLAETIGENVEGIIAKFYEENPETTVKIIEVSSPGYGGTQNEGWFAAIKSIISQVEPNTTPNGKINIITPMISPADTRFLKDFLTSAGVDFILIPDLSDNLDGVTEKHYNRLKTGGTSLEDISKAAGSKLTIEFSVFEQFTELSPGAYLEEKYGVPCVRLPLPVGIRGTDELIKTIAENGGIIPDYVEKQRGRYIDAMIDSHKYCSEAKAAIFGEPDFVYAMTRLCTENGILPVVVVTAAVSDKFKELISKETETCRKLHFESSVDITDDTDFKTIEELCVKNGANILIGSSDARRIAHKLNIPLIRCAFPIHDYVGGQRVRTLGFEGSVNILDKAANEMIERKETSFRSNLYTNFFELPERHFENNLEKEYEKTSESDEELSEKIVASSEEQSIKPFKINNPDLAAKTAAHPCFGENACKNARVHLPVAPKCNIQCNYCLRNYDCMNESRPGVVSKIINPSDALERYKILKEKLPNLTVAGVAGPGDALANFEETEKTLKLIREYDPDVTFCIATNGLMLPFYVQRIKELSVSHVTVTVNAVEPEIGAKIYKHINYFGKTYKVVEGAAILLANQIAGIKMLSEAGILCKVNCVCLKGINDNHIYEVTQKVAQLGAFMTNIIPHIPVKDTPFEVLEKMTDGEIDVLREECGVNIKQMKHCRQCRSDAAGTLDNDISFDITAIENKPIEIGQTRKKLSLETETYAADNFINNSSETEVSRKILSPETELYAVATESGMIVDSHFGKVSEFYIYECDGIDVKFKEIRRIEQYCDGSECEEKQDKWVSILKALEGCIALIAMKTGSKPTEILEENGIEVITACGRIEDIILNTIKERKMKYAIA